jgi:hypothetical protein
VFNTACLAAIGHYHRDIITRRGNSVKKRIISSTVLALAVACLFIGTAALPANAATAPINPTPGPNDDALITNVVVTPVGSDVTVSFDAQLQPGHTSATIAAVIDEGVAGPTDTFTSGTVAYSYEFTALSNGIHEVDVYTSTTLNSVQGGDYVWSNTYTFPYVAPSNGCGSWLSRLVSFVWSKIVAWNAVYHI